MKLGKIKEIENKINTEGNIEIFNYLGLIGLVERPHLTKRIYNDWKEQLIHWCGYTIIPNASPIGIWVEGNKEMIVDLVDVHGGITLFEEREGVIWIGFDTAHYNDMASLDDENGTYRDKEYVISETKKMIKQISELFLKNLRDEIMGASK